MANCDRPYKILIVEDHRILREGLRAILSDFAEYRVVGEAGDGLEGLRYVRESEPDLVLLDLSMPRMNGLDIVAEILRESPRTKILILSVHDSEEYYLPVLQAGAHGYVLKDAKRDELLSAISHVLQGSRFISPGICRRMDAASSREEKNPDSADPLALLTTRERQILKLIAEGHTNRQIAELLFISPKTADNHRTNLMQKLDLHSVQALTAFAFRKGLLVNNEDTA